METPLTESEMIALPSRESSEIAGPAESDGTPPTITRAVAAENNDSDNLTKLLPSNTFAQISSTRCFLFPGAEVTWDNLNGAESDDSDDGEFSEDDLEEEELADEMTSVKPAEIVPDIDNGLSNDQVPISDCSLQPQTSDIPSPLSTSQLRSFDEEKVEIITDIQADEATKEPIDECIESVPAKRIRLSTDVSADTEKTF